VTDEYIAPGQVGTYRNCDLIALVIDLSADAKDQADTCLEFLESRNLLQGEETGAVDEHGNALGKRVICMGSKCDAAGGRAAEALRQPPLDRFESIQVSAVTGTGMDRLPDLLYRALGIIRVYAKPPGEKADMEEPFTLPAGSTVMDLAVAIHRELAEKLKSARIWGTGVYDGQNVQRMHVINDKDIIELHFS
jgi:hypothetical protein